MPLEKDGAAKMLLDFNEVFAEVLNVTLFHGKPVVRPEDLSDGVITSQMKLDDGKLHNQERDILKYWKHGSIVIAAVGMENQSVPVPYMPLRSFGYDGATYQTQVSRYLDEVRNHLPITPFYPAITVVLYFGLKKWNGPRTLRDCFQNVPEDLKPLIPDYPLHIIEVANMTEEEVSLLRSDFRFVARLLTGEKSGKGFQFTDEPIAHVDATLKFLYAVTGDETFEEVRTSAKNRGEEPMTMIDVFGRFRAEERARYEVLLADKDRALMSKDRTIADKDRAIADNLRTIKELRERLHKYETARQAL